MDSEGVKYRLGIFFTVLGIRLIGGSSYQCNPVREIYVVECGLKTPLLI